MKSLRISSFVLLLVLSFSVLFSGLTPAPVSALGDDFDCSLSAVNADSSTNLSHYGAKTVAWYNQEQATTAQLPQGFSGEVVSVVEVDGNVSKGVQLDFTDLDIPVGLVDSIAFRIYVGDDGTNDNYPCVRIPKPYHYNEWTVNKSINDKTDGWIDFVVGREQTCDAVVDFTELASGIYLGVFEFAVRHSVAGFDFYIDSIKINLINNDNTAPLITSLDGAKPVVYKGRQLKLNIVAFDQQENREVPVSYTWLGNPALDEFGVPEVGEYIVIVTAEDFFGNSSSFSTLVEVREPDEIKPQITLTTTEIYIKAGVYPSIVAVVTDNIDTNVSTEYIWSDGAFDLLGRFVKGTHTLTIKAVDINENEEIKQITVFVTDEGYNINDIIDEEQLIKQG